MPAFNNAPEHSSAAPVEATEKPLRSVTEIEQAHQVQAETIGQIHQSEEKEEGRQRDLHDLIADDWELLDDGQVLCCGVSIPEDSFPNVVAQKLQWYEQKTGVQLSSETPDEDLTAAITEALTYTEAPQSLEVSDTGLPKEVEAWVELEANCPAKLRQAVCGKYLEMAEQHPEISQYPVEQLLPTLVEELVLVTREDENVDEIAAIDKATEEEKDKNVQRRTRNDVLSKIQERHSDKSGAERLQAIYADVFANNKTLLGSDPENVEPRLASFSEEERAKLLPKLQAFMDMLEMAQGPEDQAIISSKMNTMDFSAGIPNPLLFIESEILADENLSEAYRDSVATKFNLPNPRVKTGGQVDQTLDATDENGQPAYTEANPVALGKDSVGYVKPDGERVVAVDTGDGRRREIPLGNESDHVIGLKVSLVKIWGQNEWDGQTDFFGESVDIETDILSQTDLQKLTKLQNTLNAILGGNRGYDAVIVQDHEIDFIGWFNQHTSTKGDAAIGDFDQNTAVENRTNIGFHPKGNPTEIDYEVLRGAANYAKGEYGGGEPNYYGLQRHLHGLFPEKDIPLTGENAPDKT